MLQARLARLQRGVPSFTWFHDRELKDRPDGPGMQLLIDLSTVNHTSFFREAARLRFLAERLAKRLRRGRPGPVRVWSAGCSAGQEPYSLAMDLTELVSGLGSEHLELWASDLSLEMIRHAARAIYNGATWVTSLPSGSGGSSSAAGGRGTGPIASCPRSGGS